MPALIDALRDKDKVVRMESARALGRMGGAARSAVPALTAATKDSDDLVKRAAAQSLEAIQAGTDVRPESAAHETAGRRSAECG